MPSTTTDKPHAGRIALVTGATRGINNAAIFESATWDDLDFDLWQRIMAAR
jgi:hypothetical protein